MAKVRVYELARELNMESKVLVEKLLAGGVNIKNYMSTLDEDAVARARDVVEGKVSEVIEEKRIKPTVIRRRKKTVEVKPEEVSKRAKKAKAEAVEQEPPTPEEVQKEKEAEILTETLEAKEEIKAEEAAPTEEAGKEEIVEKEAEVSEEAKPKRVKAAAKGKAKTRKAKKKAVEIPAKIIKKPEEGPLKELVKKKKEKAGKGKAVADVIPITEVPTAKPEEKAGKPAKKKKEKKRATKEEPIRKKVARHRKLEVFERADLYEGRVPRRKGRKAEKRAREAGKKFKQTEITVPRASKRRIKVQEQVTVGDLAKVLGIKSTELIKSLLTQGVMATVNQTIDFETASLIADEFGYELELDHFELETLIADEEDKPEDQVSRPPVVTIMGHVDHGKTSLLDYIRNSNIIAGESGGITQHIGAYYVKAKGGDIVFLDTPGHEAFTAMRARGAKVTDIIVLVVAADDGVMPQTREAVNHARAADIPIIVAVNKIDKAESDPDRVRRELSELGMVPEEWGGDTLMGLISAKSGEGVDELLELISLQSEILELKANPDRSARGTIIEARLDRSKGSVATVLIKKGTLHQGDHFVSGDNHGRVRAMLNHRGKKMSSAGPSIPVEIYGISGVPMAGDEFIVVQDEKTAKQIIEHREMQIRQSDQTRRGIVSLDDLFDKIKEGEVKELNIVLKADVQGSLEALSESLIKLSTDEVKLKVIHSSTGGITESDVMLASASGAIILGFNVRANPRVTEIAEKENVDIRYYDVIYKAIQDIRGAMEGLLEPLLKENVIGRANIIETFHVPKVGTIAGCQVTEGHVARNAKARVLRDDVVIHDGKIASLKRFKEDVKQVQTGYECGIGLENYQDLKIGDVFEVYEIEEVAAEL